MLKIRRPLGRLIFNMGIAIPGKTVFLIETAPWACFLSLAWRKLRLCLANHRPDYWSNLPCDWLSTAWAYFKQETENWPRGQWVKIKSVIMSPPTWASQIMSSSHLPYRRASFSMGKILYHSSPFVSSSEIGEIQHGSVITGSTYTKNTKNKHHIVVLLMCQSHAQHKDILESYPEWVLVWVPSVVEGSRSCLAWVCSGEWVGLMRWNSSLCCRLERDKTTWAFIFILLHAFNPFKYPIMCLCFIQLWWVTYTFIQWNQLTSDNLEP